MKARWLVLLFPVAGCGPAPVLQDYSYARGYSGEDRDILFIIVERLDLAALKEIVLQEDPSAFIAIENLHEVAYGRTARVALRRKARNKFTKGFL